MMQNYELKTARIREDFLKYKAEHPERRVFVLDTLSAGPEIKLAIEYIRRGVLNGVDYEEICTGVQEYIRHTGLIFMLKSLKNFAFRAFSMIGLYLQSLIFLLQTLHPRMLLL